MAAVQLITKKLFTGGLNLRADAFQLGDNESPDMMNVDVDPRGGFRIRRSWADWELVDTLDWDPRSLYSHRLADGNETLFLSNGSELWIREAGGDFVEISGVVLAGDPHSADFASWNDDVYLACGRTQTAHRWSGGAVTALSDPSLGLGGSQSWTVDALTPAGNQMPKAEFAVVHNGYMWVANTNENGTSHPLRVRFSLPNDPDSWQELDFIDIPDGNGPITGIVPLRDQLLIFTPSSVFAILGYDLSSLQRVGVTKMVGAANRQCIARSETSVYFASWPEGVHRVSLDSLDEVSVLLRPALDSDGFSPNTDLQWLSFAGQRLYWSVPYDSEGAPLSSRSVFVFDPSLESWTVHRAGDGEGVAPIVNSSTASGPIGASRSAPTILDLNGDDTAVDVIAGVSYPIPAHYRTGWFDASLPTMKKRWRRPDIVADEDETSYDMTIFVYHDYDSTNAKRTKVVSVSSNGSGGVWTADPEWDGSDGSLLTPPPGAPIWWETPDPLEAGWGASPNGSSIERSSALGAAAAVQLEFRGQEGRRWGVNALVMKYLLRRIR